MQRMLRPSLILLLSTLLFTCVSAQSEIRWDINLNTDQIVQTDKPVLQALEKDLIAFLNSQTYTNDDFAEDERIEATLFLTIKEVFEESNGASVPIPNQFTATMAIQSLRPIYGVGEQTPVLNAQDKFVDFNYQQGEGVQYSEQSYISDLGSIITFYGYLIVGLDYETFAPLGGEPYFAKARELYNRLPTNVQSRNGWEAKARGRNRFWLMDNILDARFLPIRRAYYTYHRLGLDMMTTDQIAARNNVTLAIQDVQKAAATSPNSVLAQVFVDAKREEIIEIYKGATGVEQNTVITAMQRIDPAKASQYRGIRTTAPRRGRTPSRAPVGRNRRGVQ